MSTLYKIFNKDLVVYYGQNLSFTVQPVEEDGWKPKPETLQLEGFIYRPGDDITVYNQPISITEGVATIIHDPNRRFDYSYRYNLYVRNGLERHLFQYGNVIFKNEHRESD